MTIFDWRQNHGNERISYIERAWECLLMSNLRVAGDTPGMRRSSRTIGSSE
jgi:hypothetical protein